MKKIRVEEAVGLTLCHDVTAMRDGFKGAEFSRGHVIEEKDITRLLDIGKRFVFVWTDVEGEIHEEDAALRMKNMTIEPNMEWKGPTEGKIQFFAKEDGFFTVDRELLEKINNVKDLTITCLPNHYPVKKGSRLASMRIVPLATEVRNIEEAEALIGEERLFKLHPYREMKVGIIITGSEIYSGRIKDKFETVARAKLAQYPTQIIGVRIVDDNLDMILETAEEFLRKGADMLIFSGGMSVDPDDLTPTAIKRLGADIISYGVPSQPGNMTLVSYLGAKPVLGVPGAAISMPTTVFDVLLPQIFAGLQFSAEELRNLADGGLCQLCEACHWPNCTFGRY